MKQHGSSIIVIFIAVCCVGLIAALGYVFYTQFVSKEVAQQDTAIQEPKLENATESANSWSGHIDKTAIPLGDNRVSSTPRVGYTYSCTTSFRGGGARHAGDWINDAASTWDVTKKVSVLGAVSWPNAHYVSSSSARSRTLTTNSLPANSTTGIFPIAQTDPAYQYDTNPNSIVSQNLTYSVPLNPSAAPSASCLSLGAIGVMENGVVLFNALDDAGRDAVAHETQDSCDGHPNGRETYHYHDVSECILTAEVSTSQLVGYALDGFGIYVERDSKGNLPTNADLDECHGRTSEVMWNGELTTIYHYSATTEYPYVIGCFRGMN